jgi:uncharacterized protein with von Willebrand factor type A (vWA) domain
VICVDTSGSMRGVPEEVARSLSLGILRVAFTSRRPWRVYLTLDGPQHLFWAPRDESGDRDASVPSLAAPERLPEALLVDLSILLGRELAGGMDSTPALDDALAAIETEGRSHVDLVLVSDITTPKITPTHMTRIYRLQRDAALRFHAVTINRTPMNDPLNVFDLRWHYRADGGAGIDDTAFRGMYPMV